MKKKWVHKQKQKQKKESDPMNIDIIVFNVPRKKKDRFIQSNDLLLTALIIMLIKIL